MFTKIEVARTQRAIMTRNNRFGGLLMPGVHRIFSAPIWRIGLEYHELREPVLKSKWTGFLVDKRPDLVAEHFVLVKTGTLEVAMVSVNGTLHEVLLPEKRILVWKASGIVSIELENIGEAEFEEPALQFEDNFDDWVYETQEDS